VRWGLLIVSAGAAWLISSCSGEPGSVTMAGHSFEPANLTVRAGDPIRFRNDTSEAHSVTAYGDSLPDGAEYFASGGARGEREARENISEGLLQPGKGYRVTLQTPGTYRYFCLPHEDDGMVGSITVESS
jgi:plastocyanin